MAEDLEKLTIQELQTRRDFIAREQARLTEEHRKIGKIIQKKQGENDG